MRIVTLTPHVDPVITERLRAIDPEGRLHLRPRRSFYADRRASDPIVGRGDLERQQPSLEEGWVFGVCMTWAEQDPRRAMIRNGTMSPDADFDLLADVPVDCPTDQIPAYLERTLVARPEGWARELAEKVGRWNEEVSIKQGEELADYAVEVFRANMHRMDDIHERIPRSFGGLPR